MPWRCSVLGTWRGSSVCLSGRRSSPRRQGVAVRAEEVGGLRVVPGPQQPRRRAGHAVMDTSNQPSVSTRAPCAPLPWAVSNGSKVRSTFPSVGRRHGRASRSGTSCPTWRGHVLLFFDGRFRTRQDVVLPADAAGEVAAGGSKHPVLGVLIPRRVGVPCHALLVAASRAGRPDLVPPSHADRPRRGAPTPAGRRHIATLPADAPVLP